MFGLQILTFSCHQCWRKRLSNSIYSCSGTNTNKISLVSSLYARCYCRVCCSGSCCCWCWRTCRQLKSFTISILERIYKKLCNLCNTKDATTKIKKIKTFINIRAINHYVNTCILLYVCIPMNILMVYSSHMSSL